ncbi:MAG TPA: dephospho-CoA kinase [Blastocatellia bacterium]|nr:dephospho-CoA kinase [Blastocatellia bacterium]HMV84473.1 dephospho-CoA kinase [Blastocatellia bacterium]HMX26229.1 dephospho-CoA kinase [Blastocatellia bacterium]HMY73049.1 dephospho-CoA kinase [Blastocatellia bacterium]HMZ18870.1 dephospho-CoA kinase [Blastocatellia bacterium]
MLKVGLTGGIATGKSYVLAVLRELGCAVLDADLTAREVVEPGQPAFEEIVAHFSHEILGADGKLDRAKLGAIVFANAAERERLNAIVHPRVFESQANWLAEIERRDPQVIAVIDAALMIETGSYRRFDKLVVVYCEPEIQLERLMARNQMSSEDALARISAQMPSAEKLHYADFSINTSLGFEDTRRQVETLHAKLHALRTR